MLKRLIYTLGRRPKCERPYCLRCVDTPLDILQESNYRIAFYECPSCNRQFAQKLPGELTYRWLHPVSLALYPILFDADPLPRAEELANEFVSQHSNSPCLKAMLAEIALELEQPTQQVRVILDNPQTETICRQFLARFLSHAQADAIGK